MSRKPIAVHHEWGALKEVIVGVPNVRLPSRLARAVACRIECRSRVLPVAAHEPNLGHLGKGDNLYKMRQPWCMRLLCPISVT